MAYYVYKMFSPKRLEFLDEFEAYREAKTFTRSKRKQLTPEDDFTIRMVFAPSKEHAERLLKEVREARPMGEDA
jgi:hypothetical protein